MGGQVMEEVEMPTRHEVEQKVMDAFYNEKKIKVTRKCFGEEETCIGFIYKIARSERPKNDKKKEVCFSMVADDKWWRNGTLQSLSPWVSQIAEIELMQ